MQLTSSEHPTLNRLDDQINWYDRKSHQNHKWYTSLKMLQIVAGAGVPLTAGLTKTPWITGSLGALIVVFEGLQSLNHFHENWIAYRATCEQLRHEKFLWAAKAGPYRDVSEPEKLLAERVEALVSTEHAKWLSSTAVSPEKKSDHG